MSSPTSGRRSSSSCVTSTCFFSLSDLAAFFAWLDGVGPPSRTGWTGWAGLVRLGNYFGCQKTFFKKVLAKPARLPYSNFSREGAQRRSKLGLRLVVGQRILVPSTGVRLSQSQPFATSTHMARSSSGSGRRPLKAEITSSNLVRATKRTPASFRARRFFLALKRHDRSRPAAPRPKHLQ